MYTFPDHLNVQNVASYFDILDPNLITVHPYKNRDNKLHPCVSVKYNADIVHSLRKLLIRTYSVDFCQIEMFCRHNLR